MAMLVLPDVIARTWGERARPSDGSPPVDDPFWPAATVGVRRRRPGTCSTSRLLDSEAALQQEALGLLGVNLIYATSFLHGDVDAFVASLGDHLSRDRVEVDFVDVGGWPPSACPRS
jgi:hypothetical protein